MLLERLVAHDFRNLRHLELTPAARFTVLEGDNGQGKTAILEAIYVMACLKSFRAHRTADLVRHGEADARIHGLIVHDGVHRSLDVELGARRRRVSLDGKAARSLTEALGQLTVVLFAPEDLAITKGGPAHRRTFLDRAVFNRFPSSLDDMKRFEIALKQRNALLRDGGPDRLLDAFDEQLAPAATRVVGWRTRYLSDLKPFFESAISEVTRGSHHAELRYEGSTPAGEDLIDWLRRRRVDDRRRSTTTTGPHVDDIGVFIDGHLARVVASQGQHRALVLALKIAEIRLLQDAFGYSPLLLLDDVSSELDASRNAELMRYLGGPAFDGQVFLTTTDRRHVLIDAPFSCLTIRAGEVVA
ncbi:MAG: DNA replication/repair protein RecF [Myxococcales bacterium]|nr:DNA replication/repair protein RecF [Myxococcales bacterium]